MTDLTDKLAAIPKQWAQPPAEMIGKLPKGGTTLDYVGHSNVTRILLEIDPLWTLEPVCDDRGIPIVTEQGSDLVMWGWLSVCGHRRLGVGTCTAKAFDVHKQLLSDLLRNCAMRFGIALSLWSKEEWTDPPPPPEPFATPAQIGEVRASIDLLADPAPFKAWWKSAGLPKLEQLTESQAATVLARLKSSDTSPSVEQPTTPEGSEGGEEPAVDLVGDREGEPAGSTHPGGPPSAAARKALERNR